MSYENHINKFVNAAAIQAAIDNGDLVKPYVALDASAGTIDYNTRSVTPPPMGEWSIDSDGHYVFTLLETTYGYWANDTTIGYLNNVYVNSQLVPSLEITLSYDSDDMEEWFLCPHGVPGCTEEPFTQMIPISFSSGKISTNLESSDATVKVIGSAGNRSFSLYSADSNHPLTMTTVNPPYPE